MWNQKRSLALSKISVLVFMGLLLVLFFTIPWLVRLLMDYSINAHEKFRFFFYATLYTGGVTAFILLYDLYQILKNIGNGNVFIYENVRHLRRISWFCILGAVICLVSCLYYFPWLFVGAAAAFMGLIVRVVKNVVAQAIVLKEENDYTI